MPSAIFGREAELRTLDELVAGGGALVISGEPGIGRTTVARCAAHAVTLLETAGCAAETGLPGAGLHRLLRPVRSHIAALAAQHADALTRAADGHAGDLAVPVALVELLSTLDPVLCVADDADQLDDLTLGALAFAARRLGSAAEAARRSAGSRRVAMIFVTGIDVPEALDGLPVLRLRGLDREAALALLDEDLPAPVKDALVRTSAGNPLALRELAASLTVRQRRGQDPPPAVPPADGRLRHAYRQKLDRLPPDARRALLLAAADDELTVDELIAAAGLSAIEPLQTQNLLLVRDSSFSVQPSLLLATTYAESILAERHSAHQALARTVKSPLRRALHVAATVTSTDDALATDLARHAADAAPKLASRALEQAARLCSDTSTSGGYLVAAARNAWRAGEPGRARQLLARVVSSPDADLLAAELDDSPDPRRLIAAADRLDRRAALDALVAAGDALCLTGGYSGLHALAERAEALRDHSPESALLVDYLAGVAAIYDPNYARAAAPLRRVQILATRLAGSPARPRGVEALTRASTAAVLLGEDAAARVFADRAAALARSHGDLAILPVALETSAHARLALGRHEDAAAALSESADAARDSGQDTGSHLAMLAVLAAMHGDTETAYLRVRQAGSRAWAVGDWALALADLLAGRPEQSLRRMPGTCAHRVVAVAAAPCGVEAAARSGQLKYATWLAGEFDGWALHTGNPDWLALSARCHALAAGDHPVAAEHYRRALAEHELGASEFEHARTALLYGELLRRRRRPTLARDQLRSALDTFQRLGRGWWAARVEAELRAAGEVAPGPVSPPYGKLTAQQTQIARLVAAGATNREVASRLFLSPRTVDHHLRNIFTRLGIRSRVDLARIYA